LRLIFVMLEPVSDADLDAITLKTVHWIKRATGKEIASPSLLKRPPFRFVHEVVMEIVVVTGFGLGVWDGSEMDAVGLRSSEGREGKTRFLQKLIAVTLVGKRVSEFTGQFRPSSIIAGNEPERTNILLQVRLCLSHRGRFVHSIRCAKRTQPPAFWGFEFRSGFARLLPTPVWTSAVV
jgi:hypothetical protein